MATSSIKKSFVVKGKKQVKVFADALSASLNDNKILISNRNKYRVCTYKEANEFIKTISADK